ncbi:MAG: SPOR domain-containing protein [Pseudomonadota bacterium]
MGGLHLGRIGAVVTTAMFLTACEDGQGLVFLQPAQEDGAPMPVQEAASGEFRDVEAPDVFSETETALWDGRPTLGGVWVAHPDVGDAERVLIRNQTNGQTVVGALFRRERENPGPRFQASSDAASALNMLAGQPTELSVIALRREEIPVEVAPSEPLNTAALEAETIEAAPLDPLAAAAAAIDEAEAAPIAAIPEPETAVASATPRPVSTLDKPYIQIGIFNVESNATNTAASLRTVGILPTVLRGSSQGKTFWRVVVGPSPNASERAAVLRQVKGLGFEDAYFVTN